jgi:hypothetical protein
VFTRRPRDQQSAIVRAKVNRGIGLTVVGQGLLPRGYTFGRNCRIAGFHDTRRRLRSLLR